MSLNNASEATAVSPTANPNVYRADLKPDWAIGVVPHGGYLSFIIARTARLHFELRRADLQQLDLITIHQEFVSMCAVGPVELVVTEISLGRQYSTLRVQMYQRELVEGESASERAVLRIEALLRQGNLAREANAAGLTLKTLGVESGKWGQVPNRQNCAELRDPNEMDIKRPVLAKVIMLYPRKSHESGSAPSLGTSVREQWMSWRDGDTGFDVPALCFLADTSKPLIEAYGVTGYWFPTLSFGVEVKKSPPKEGWRWLFVRIEAHQIKDGRFDMNVVILDENKELVALSKQTALVVPAARNLGRKIRVKI